jgi:hypothetical protein
MRLIRSVATAVFLFAAAGMLEAQTGNVEPASLIGLNLENLIGRYGVPQLVYAARGLEEWQDDVVFSYPWAELYIYRDHVWQAAVQSVFGVRVGDPKAVALLVLGEAASDYGTYLQCPLEGQGWPMSLRCNLDNAGKITAIFISRSDL